MSFYQALVSRASDSIIWTSVVNRIPGPCRHKGTSMLTITPAGSPNFFETIILIIHVQQARLIFWKNSIFITSNYATTTHRINLFMYEEIFK